jgi:Tol biopolymer transport system component
LSVYDIDQGGGYKVQLPFEIQMTTFMAWSPDGRKLAFSANQQIAALKPILYETQLAGMSASDIAIYDLMRNETYLLPGASDPYLLEVYPQWSPDGSLLVFSRSPVGLHPAHIRFDLWAMCMDGGKNTGAYPIEGASGNGRSNYFARFSPDGKWFSFCQCDGGDLIRSSSDIYLKAGDLQGPAHRLACNTPYAADSWHSWSSNSRWLVFSSKREGGIYAYLYLTHIDETGHASPAVRLPMREKPHASFNIPEFVANDPGIREADLFEAIRVEREPRVVQERRGMEG